MDTIFALATAQGKAGVAVIRLSGPRAWEAARSLAGDLPLPRRAGLRVLRDPDGQLLDEALVLCFENRHSFTGEEVAELQLHGSPAITAAVQRVLSDMGLRPAEPGEFTRRALENERLDVAQVEGLADLIDAESEAQRRQAMRVFSGHLGARADAWRQDLLRAAALLEATIDFADEEVPVDVRPEVREILTRLHSALSAEAAGAQVAERVRSGFEIAIVGAPNVGKSTLLNRLAGRDAAITSEIAGTTRDVIEVQMDLRGLPVTFLDTAGLRVAGDEIERLGIERARQRAEQADLRLILVAPGDPLPLEPLSGDLVLAPKADLGGEGISGLTGQGVDAMLDHVIAVLEQRVQKIGTATRERHRIALSTALESLDVALNNLDQLPEDVLAEELRTATRALASLVGRVDVEAVLGEIFSSFCIGK